MVTQTKNQVGEIIKQPLTKIKMTGFKNKDVLNRSFQPHNDMLNDGEDHALLHAGEKHAECEITCTGNGATKTGVFTVQGAVNVEEIWARCAEATNSTTFSTVYFDVLDSNAGHANITLETGVDCSGIVKRAEISKTAAVTSAATFTNPTAVKILDGGLADIFSPFKIIPYTVDGTTTIRFCYTGDADTDVDLKINIRYIPLSNATVVCA